MNQYSLLTFRNKNLFSEILETFLQKYVLNSTSKLFHTSFENFKPGKL